MTACMIQTLQELAGSGFRGVEVEGLGFDVS